VRGKRQPREHLCRGPALNPPPRPSCAAAAQRDSRATPSCAERFEQCDAECSTRKTVLVLATWANQVLGAISAALPKVGQGQQEFGAHSVLGTTPG
jgi:hypothetical protein